jgi:hypothetical protein
VLTRLSKVRVDDRVLRVLTAVQTGSRLRELAMRGARYGLPGWITTQETRGGSSRASTSRAPRPSSTRAIISQVP